MRKILLTLLVTLITFSAMAEDKPDRLYVQYGKNDLVSYMDLNTKIEMKEVKDGIYTCTFELNKDTGYYFCLWNFGKHRPWGPGKMPAGVALDMQIGETITQEIFINSQIERGDCWYWASQTDEVTFAVSVDWNKQEITIERIVPIIPPTLLGSISIRFAADNFEFGQYLANYIWIYNPYTEQNEDLVSNPYTMEFYEGQSTYMVRATNGYRFELECTDYTGSLADAPYTITPTVETDDENPLFTSEAQLELKEGADGLSFLINIKRVPQENLPERLYVMVGEYGITLNYQLEPAEDDPYLELNETTGCYEGTIAIGKRRFKFYESDGEGGAKSILGQNGTDADGIINFNSSYYPYTWECAWDAWNCYYLGYSFNNESLQQIQMVVNPEEGNVLFTPILPDPPAQLYVWGSKDGGHEIFTNDAVLTADQEDPNIFTGSVEVPYVGEGVWEDPDTGVRYPFEGWHFMLGVNFDHVHAGLFRGNEGARMGDITESDYTTLLMGKNPIQTLYSGKAYFIFNWRTYEFIAICPGTSVVSEIETETSPSAPCYYNLHGQKIYRPEKGIYIKVENGKAEKIIR